MKILLFDTFLSLGIEEPIKFSVDGEDAISRLGKNTPRAAKWLAVPVEGEVHGAQIKNLISYCESKNIKKIFAYFTQLKDKREVFEAAPSVASLQKIVGNSSLRAYTIIPVPGYFQIISDGDYYTVFAGDESFLSVVLGESTEGAIGQFKQYAESYPSNSPEQRRIAKVLNVCRLFNGGEN